MPFDFRDELDEEVNQLSPTPDVDELVRLRKQQEAYRDAILAQGKRDTAPSLMFLDAPDIPERTTDLAAENIQVSDRPETAPSKEEAVADIEKEIQQLEKEFPHDVDEPEPVTEPEPIAETPDVTPEKAPQIDLQQLMQQYQALKQPTPPEITIPNVTQSDLEAAQEARRQGMLMGALGRAGAGIGAAAASLGAKSTIMRPKDAFVDVDRLAQLPVTEEKEKLDLLTKLAKTYKDQKGKAGKWVHMTLQDKQGNPILHRVNLETGEKHPIGTRAFAPYIGIDPSTQELIGVARGTMDPRKMKITGPEQDRLQRISKYDPTKPDDFELDASQRKNLQMTRKEYNSTASKMRGAMKSARTVAGEIKANEALSPRVAQTQIPRLMGEVGNLAEFEQKGWEGSPAIWARFGRFLRQNIMGKEILSETDVQALQNMIDRTSREIMAEIDQARNRYSQQTWMTHKVPMDYTARYLGKEVSEEPTRKPTAKKKMTDKQRNRLEELRKKYRK